MSTFKTLLGFREFYPEDCAFRNFIFENFRKISHAFGFEEYDAPLLEPTELFTAKSGDEIVTQLFNFEDKGGRKVAMRPEMTPSLARMVGTHANAMKRPIKWFNISEAFRYERPQKGRLRSFYQFNADLLGDDSLQADAEIIALGIHTLKSFGLKKEDFHIRLSDRKLWTLFIQSCGIADHDIQAVLSVIDKIEREDPEKIIANLNNIAGVDGEKIFNNIVKIKDTRSLEGIKKLFSEIGSLNKNIVYRLEEFEKLLQRLATFGFSDFITIDFSIVRGLAYYTGFVFEIFERSGQSRALAGGGRYDNLIKKLGYNELPAVGFAIGDVTLGNLLKEKNLAPKFSKNIKCFVIHSEQTEAAAMQTATILRENGINTDYCLKPVNFGKQLKAASQADAQFAIFFGGEELKVGNVKIKNLSTGDEKTLNCSEITDFVLKC